MIDQRIIRNYAKSLFSNIELDKDHELVLSQLSLFSEVMAGSRLVHFALCAPVISRFEKFKLIEALGTKISFHKILKQFLLIINKNSRFSVLSSVSAEYEKLLATSRGIKFVTVEFANKPMKKELKIITEHLENTLKQIVKLDIVDNKSLLGGVVIKYDSFLYDYSISGVIDRVEKLARI